jgi:hypothetical protein
VSTRTPPAGPSDPSDPLKSCPDGFEDAVAKTRGSDGGDAQINFMIVFF